MSFVYSINGVPVAVAHVLASRAAISAAGQQGMRDATQYGESVVKSYASGRPGPIPRTGDHRRTIRGEIVSVDPSLIIGQIGSNLPYSARLEYGFVGQDILGRNYNQAPYPYMAPAFPIIEQYAETTITAAISRAL